MKTLMLNAEDIQTLGKLLPHAVTTTAATTAINNNNIIISKVQQQHQQQHSVNNTATLQHQQQQAHVNRDANGAINLLDDNRNMLTLQYYLKHPKSSYTTPLTTPTTNNNVNSIQQQSQQQQQQQRQQQTLFVTQTQLKQLPQLKQPNTHHVQHQHINNYHHQHQHHHHHPYYPQQTQHLTSQQQQKQQQQQNNYATTNNNNNNTATTTTSIITTATRNVPAITKTQQQQQQQQQQSSSTQKTQVLPVHALNQNSNFSAASSSTGGGTASSHAPTQQSNTTGSSFSPPGATANKRNTPASNNNNTVSSTTTNSRLSNNGGGGLSVSNTTGGSGGTKKLKTEPMLSQFHQNERLAFANTHIVWSEEHWKRVVFHDERKFNLDGPDGFSYYFHDLRNYERTLSQRPRGNSVFVYIVISAGGAIHLDVATTKQKPEVFIEAILRERSNITAKLGGQGDFMLQDHNWTATSLPTAQEWLSAEGIKLQKWPTIAHDLNIMENIWGWLIREVYDGGRKFSRKDDLLFRIREAWQRLPLDLITNLYSTMPERITELYYTRGIYTNC